MIGLPLALPGDPIIAEVAQDVLGKWCESLSRWLTGFKVDVDFVIRGV